MGQAKGPHHRGTYDVRSRRITKAANANPATRCWRCHRTLAEVTAEWTASPPRRRRRRRPHWTAGHLHDGQVDGPMAAECSVCNYAAGARLTNATRARRKHTSTPW